MKLLTRYSLLLLFFTALLPAVQAYTATGNLPLQVEPAGSTWDTVTADATAQSTGAASGGTPIYHSTKLEETSLEGDFTADINTTNLALFSDDGCDVTIDGKKVWADRDKGHALENLSASLHKLTITLNPGQKYHIKIDYSNIQYDGNGDIDGVTLFAWNDTPPQVTLTADDPGDPDDFQHVTSKVFAKVDHLPAGHLAADLTATWTWSVVSVTHSDTVDGAFTTTGVDASLCSVTGDNSDLTSPTATFNGEFDLDGFYEVLIRAIIKYHDNRTGEDLGPYTSADTGDVYLGDNSDEPSVAVSPSSRSFSSTSASISNPKKVKTNGIKIYKDGVLVTWQTISCYAGEPINLTVSIPSTIKPSSTTQWYLDPNYRFIKNWTVSMDDSNASTIFLSDADIHQKFLNFYWVSTGTKIEARYGGTDTRTGKYATSSVYFNVIKPLCNVKTPTSVVQAFKSTDGQTAFLGLGDVYSNTTGIKAIGISFNPTFSTLYGGSIEWVQVISNDYSPNFPPQFKNAAVLDGSYPYRFDIYPMTDDSPNDPNDQSKITSDSRTFHATMWLMWKPNVLGSIYVPLSSYDWGWSGSASQSLLYDWRKDSGTVEPVKPNLAPVDMPQWNQISRRI